MAVPIIVQTKTAANNASQTSLAAAFTSKVSARNTIIVLTSCDGNDTETVPTDTLGNTYTQIFKTTVGANNVGAAYYAYNILGGTNTVTAHFGGSNTEVTMIAREYSGLDIKDPFITSVNASNSSGSSTAINSTATTNFVDSYRLVVSFGIEAFGAGQTWTVGSGYANVTSVSTNSVEGCAMADKRPGTLAAETATWTLGTGVNWIGGVATFRTLPSEVPNDVRSISANDGVSTSGTAN